MPRGWFVYNPNTVSGGVTATGNYTYNGKPFECVGSGIVCVAYAYYVGRPTQGVTHPYPPFSSNMLSYLNAGAAATQPLPLIGKKYVYIKNA